MAMSFLHQVTADLYNRYDGKLEDVTIVFPNKRAGLFANQCLSEIAGHPVWAPRYSAISDFFSSLTDKSVPDTIELLVHLYLAYQSSQKQDKVSFDRFYSWGEVLLSDFQDIDNNMVDAKRLFDNVSALEALDRIEYLEPGQIEAVKSFFTEFDPDDTNRLHQRFVDMWNSMYDIYTNFRTSLQDNGLAYEAMLKREVVENIEEAGNVLKGRKYAFVGFNVLNETEKRLFKYLAHNTETLFYWDIDETFIKHEAASFIKENMKMFPNALRSGITTGMSMCDVTIVSATTDEAQASYASQWLGKCLESDRPLNRTAVVLADESILQSVIHALPATEVNITMGYPLRQTAIASLITALLELQTRGKAKGDCWYHTYVTSILRHPFIIQAFPVQAKKVYASMHKHNEMYPSFRYLQSTEPHDRDFAAIFTPQTTDSLLPYLADITRRIGVTNKKSDPLTVESIFTMYNIITNLHSILTSPAIPSAVGSTDQLFSSLQALSLILTQKINGQSIAFHGEPATGLQVMGMLETRNLDFSNLLVLSANEGMLPKVSNGSSFIPYFLREAHNMTTIEKQTSLYAYYFFRMLQRADNVALVYNNYTEGLKKGEISRFLLQLSLEKELPVNITEKTITSPNEVCGIETTSEIVKSPEVMNRLVEAFVREGEVVVSPSALNTYIACRRKFFLCFVAGLSAPDEISEEIEADVFGNIIHDILMNLYMPYVGKLLDSGFVKGLSNDRKRIEELTDKAFSRMVFNQNENITPQYNGEQMLNKHVIMKYVRRQLEYDSTLAPITIMGLEKKVSSDVLFRVRGKSSDGSAKDYDVRLAGRIDRIDRVSVNGKAIVRIVDYKTSNSIQKCADVDSLFNPLKTSGHIFQTFCYADMYGEPCAPSLNYIKKLSDKEHRPVISLNKIPVDDFRADIRDDFHPRLVSLIKEIFNTDQSFSMSETDAHCKFCDFAYLCNRKQ